MTPQQAAAITMPKRDDLLEWCEEFRRDVRERLDVTDAELDEAENALIRVRNRIEWFVSALEAERPHLRNLAMGSGSADTTYIKNAVAELVCDALNLEASAARVAL